MTAQHPPTPRETVEGATVLRPGAADLPAPNLPLALDNALIALPQSAQGLTVLVNDPQRHTATGSVLRLLARRVKPARMRVLVATGSHATPPDIERTRFERAILGGIIPGELQWHHCCAANLAPMAAPDDSGADATSWSCHPWLMEAGAILAIGSVEPHYFAGWTGAHKTATIGVAARDDIQANHSLALSPNCRPACMDNPVAEGILAMLAALEAARPVAAINLVQAGPDIIAAAGGTVRAALQAALPAASAAFIRHIHHPADALIAEVAGPLDESFYQADKGIKNNEWAVRDGGCLILAAPCPKGIGQDHFTSLLRRAATHADALAAVESAGYRLGDHKAVRLRYLTDPACRAVRVYVVSKGLFPADAALLGLQKAPTISDALAAANIRPNRDKILHIQDAGNLCVLPVASN